MEGRIGKGVEKAGEGNEKGGWKRAVKGKRKRRYRKVIGGSGGQEKE